MSPGYEVCMQSEMCNQEDCIHGVTSTSTFPKRSLAHGACVPMFELLLAHCAPELQ